MTTTSQVTLKKKFSGQITEIPHGCTVQNVEGDYNWIFSSAIAYTASDRTTNSIFFIPYASNEIVRLYPNDTLTKIEHEQLVGYRGWNSPMQINPWNIISSVPTGLCQNIMNIGCYGNSLEFVPTGLTGGLQWSQFTAPVMDDETNIWYCPNTTLNSNIMKVNQFNGIITLIPYDPLNISLSANCSEYDKDLHKVWIFGNGTGALAIDIYTNSIKYISLNANISSCKIVGDYIWLMPSNNNELIYKINRNTYEITTIDHGQGSSETISYGNSVYDKNSNLFYISSHSSIFTFNPETETIGTIYSVVLKDLGLSLINRNIFDKNRLFDGRYIYFVPGSYNKVMLYDIISHDFTFISHKQKLNTNNLSTTSDIFAGGIFDNEKENLYLIPKDCDNIVKIHLWDSVRQTTASPTFSFQTDKQGEYRIDSVSPVSVIISTELANMIPDIIGFDVESSNITDISVTRQLYSISGTVWKQFDTDYYLSNGSSTIQPNVPYAGIQVRLDEMWNYDTGSNICISYTRYATTDENGNYEFNNLPSNDFTFGVGNYYRISVPSIDTNFNFTHDGSYSYIRNSGDSNNRRHIKIKNTNVTNVNFKQCHYLFYGWTTDSENENSIVDGVTLTLYNNDTDEIIDTCICDNGYFLFWQWDISRLVEGVPTLRTYRIVAEKTGYHFNISPTPFDITTYSNTPINNFNYAEVWIDANLDKFAISGTISPIEAGILVDGGTLGTTTTDSNGTYSFTNVPYGTEYTITPSSEGYAFTPNTASGIVTDSVSANFSRELLTHTISGQVNLNGLGIENILLTLSGESSDTTTTDSSGNYSFSGLSSGSYTITPSYTSSHSQNTLDFTPASSSVTVSNADVINDIAATMKQLIYLCPSNSSNIGIYSINSSTLSNISISSYESGLTTNYNSALYDGTDIWFSPHSANNILKMNAVTQEITSIEKSSSLEYGLPIVESSSGYKKIWFMANFVQNTSSAMFYVDSRDNSKTTITIPNYGYTRPYRVMVYCNGYIWLIPYQHDQFVYFDPANPTVFNTLALPTTITGNKFSFGAFDGTYLWCSPCANTSGSAYAAKVDVTNLIVTLYTNSYLTSGNPNSYNYGCISGDYFWNIPNNSHYFVKINRTDWSISNCSFGNNDGYYDGNFWGPGFATKDGLYWILLSEYNNAYGYVIQRIRNSDENLNSWAVYGTKGYYRNGVLIE